MVLMFSISDYLNFSECDTSDSDFVENNSQGIIGKGEGGNRTTGRGTGAGLGQDLHLQVSWIQIEL